MARTILVGDVHGCLDELRALLQVVAREPSDRVILVGDLVAKGPDSQGVVQLCREEGFEAVLGNHDAFLLRLHAAGEEGLTKPPKQSHLDAAKSLTSPDWAYLGGLPLWRRDEAHGVVVVHGGLLPGVPLEEQSRDDCLNLRSIRPDGSGTSRIEEGVPWASLWPGPEQVVFGHDAVRGLQRHPHATGLDSGCVYGRALTALVLPEGRLVSVPARQMYAPPGD